MTSKTLPRRSTRVTRFGAVILIAPDMPYSPAASGTALSSDLSAAEPSWLRITSNSGEAIQRAGRLLPSGRRTR